MTQNNEKLWMHNGWLFFGLLFLLAPFITLAVKGLVILLALAGIIGLVMTRAWNPLLWLPPLAPFSLGYLFLAFALISVAWSPNLEGSLTSFAKLSASLVFTFLALHAVTRLTTSPRNETYKNILSLTLIVTIWINLLIAPWPYYGPGLDAFLTAHTGQNLAGLTGYEFELVRQVNRALTVLAILLFIIGPYEMSRRPKTFIVTCFSFLIATIFSDSQTAVLAFVLGIAGYAVARMSIRLLHNLILTCLAAGLVLAPILFGTMESTRTITDIVPAEVNELAAVDTRLHIYRVFGQESLNKPYFGHGYYSSKEYHPSDIQRYLDEMEAAGGSAVHIASARQYGTIAAHPHQIFLQVVFEFGFLGALLFWFACAQGIKSISCRIDTASHAWFLASLGPIFAQTLFGYSPWQSWLLATLGLCVLLGNIFWSERGVERSA